jgi:transcriptional regulator with AAA-type ATPase domain
MSAAVDLRAQSGLFPPRIRAWLEVVVAMGFTNPFSPERVAHEKEALPADEFVDAGWVWSRSAAGPAERANVVRIRERLRPVLETARDRLLHGCVTSAEDRRLYVDACLYFLQEQHGAALVPFIDTAPAPQQPEAARDDGRRRGAKKAAPATSPTRGLSPVERAAQAGAYAAFLRDYHAYLVHPQAGLCAPPPELVFARGYQIRRALHYVGHYIVGTSQPAARLRMRLWEAIFTSDMRGYLRGTDDGMDDVHTLVLGESGTGKELVAQALGRTGYVPFDPAEQCFTAADGEHYHCLSLVERAATLIQGELFGYDAGAFTGAERDTAGWLELLPSGGRLFLDEIGELDLALQVMLLRVIQSRTFQRLGSRTARMFHGRLLAATNQDLGAMIAAGKFRDELYQRLAVDEIRTPTLREQLADAPEDLPRMVQHIAVRMRGPDEGEALAAKAIPIIEAKRGPRYRWPGNFRELERTVRRIYVHDRDANASPSTSRPSARGDDPIAAVARSIVAGKMKWEDIERRVVAEVYKQTKSRREGARLLGMDRARFSKMVREAQAEAPSRKDRAR